MRSKSRSPRAWPFLLPALCLLTPAAVDAGPDPAKVQRDHFEECRKDFRKLRKSTSIGWDWRVLQRYAVLRDAGVLTDLLDAWCVPPAKPRRELRNLLADGLRLHARGGAPDDDGFKAAQKVLRKIVKRPEEAWGAGCVMTTMLGHEEAEGTLLELAESDEHPLIRAAAIRGLGRSRARRWLSRAPVMIKRAVASKRPLERALLLEALVEACVERAAGWFGPKAKLALDFKDAKAKLGAFTALEAIARQLGKRTVPERTERVIGAAFDRLFGEPIERDVQAVLARLEGTGEGPKVKSGGVTRERRPGPRFMSVVGKGRRFLFIIDASDSMLLPLTEAEIKAMRALLPKNSGASGKGSATTTTTTTRPLKTRLDAARMHVMATLRQMTRGDSFAILLFGSEAELLDATPGFIPVSPAGVDQVASSLWDLPIGPASLRRPNGTLRGGTNLYRALHKAFRVGAQGLVDTETPETHLPFMLEGPDTIFLLSDGSATTDGLSGLSPPQEITVYRPAAPRAPTGYRDRETGVWIGPRPKPRKPGKPRKPIGRRMSPIPWSTGPFIRARRLAGEVERLNAFRRSELHVVSIGESSADLGELAEVTGGRFVQVGEPSDDARRRSIKDRLRDPSLSKDERRRLIEEARRLLRKP